MTNLFLILLLIAIFAFLGFCLLFIIYFSSALFVWPPSIPTDRRSRKAIIRQIKEIYPPEASIKIVDMGCGYGHLLRDIARNFKSAEISGVELLWLPYVFCKVLCKRFDNISVLKGDMMEHNLSSADVVVFFLRSNHNLDEKIEKEFKGKLIVSNNFPLKNREPSKIVRVNEKAASSRIVYVYDDTTGK